MNGNGMFLWKDGRYYKGEYKDDKKHNFGIYYGKENKGYEGFWECGSQKGLGKYIKNNGSFKLGYWDENKLTSAITNEEDIANKLSEIDTLIEECTIKVDKVMTSLKSVFANYLPNVPFEAYLEFND